MPVIRTETLAPKVAAAAAPARVKPATPKGVASSVLAAVDAEEPKPVVTGFRAIFQSAGAPDNLVDDFYRMQAFMDACAVEKLDPAEAIDELERLAASFKRLANR